MVVSRTPARIGRMPSSEDYYPAASKRAEEQGSATVRVCVDARGRLIGDPTIVTSSGFSRLDEGAIRLARAGRYQPGTSGGQPQEESCVSFRVKFEIK
jgi:protein TonB